VYRASGRRAAPHTTIGRTLFEVDALGPMELIQRGAASARAARRRGGVSAIVAEYPAAGIGHYSAAKAAVSAYHTALRRERRRDGLAVIDVRSRGASS